MQFGHLVCEKMTFMFVVGVMLKPEYFDSLAGYDQLSLPQLGRVFHVETEIEANKAFDYLYRELEREEAPEGFFEECFANGGCVHASKKVWYFFGAAEDLQLSF